MKKRVGLIVQGSLILLLIATFFLAVYFRNRVESYAATVYRNATVLSGYLKSETYGTNVELPPFKRDLLYQEITNSWDRRLTKREYPHQLLQPPKEGDQEEPVR
ncbi:MAG: hypothetical protein KGZ25_10645 [Planctomycetes bacterium]|nr:hypothetical protein [Planctomycetota bacterium]